MSTAREPRGGRTPSRKQELMYSKRFSSSFSKEEINQIKTRIQNKVVVVKKSAVQREKQRSEPLLAMMVAPPRAAATTAVTQHHSNYITPRNGQVKSSSGGAGGGGGGASLDRFERRSAPFTPSRSAAFRSFGTFVSTPSAKRQKS